MATDHGQRLKVGYDDKNRVTRFVSEVDGSSIVTEYVYGDLNNGQMPDYPYGVKLDGNQILSYAYDSLGRMTSRTVDLGTDYQTAYGFLDNTDGTTTTLVDEVTESVDGASHVWSYTYDERGNITEIHLDSELLYRYSYDNLDQLVQEEDHVTDHLHVYTYDAGDNWTSHRICDLSDPWDPLSVDSYTYGDAGWKDKLTAYNGESITYDEIGNPLTWRDGAALSWQHGRELASYTKGGETYTYRYDEDGYRVAKQHGDTVTTFYLNGSSVLTQKTGDERIDFLYDDNSQLLGLKYNGMAYYYRKNLQGDITGILDPDGEQVVSYTYDAWGNPTSCTGSLASTIGQKNPFRYRGYYYDTESGLYYLNSRYYDPEVGRFINADEGISLIQGILGANIFAYCNNCPVLYEDNLGTFINIKIIRRIQQKVYQRFKKIIIKAKSKARSKNGLDTRGEPNSTAWSPNGTTKREYGPDGRAVKDTDYTNHGNPKEHPDVPHEHDWTWEGEASHRGKAHPPKKNTNLILGGVLVVGAGLGILWVTLNDATIVGVADDTTVPVLLEIFGSGWEMIK